MVRILVLIMILLFAAAMTAIDVRAGTILALIAISTALAVQVDDWITTPHKGHEP
jgi:hypothetical protein